MRSNNFFVILFSFICVSAFALTEIPAGKVRIEGKILREENKTFLVMNPGSLSQSKLLLEGNSDILKDQNDSNACLEVELDNKMMGAQGEVKFLKLIRYLHPSEDVKTYSDTQDFNL